MPVIRFSPSGTTIEVPAGSNLLDAVREAAFHVPSSCGSKGLCGKCRVKILGGRVDADSAQAACVAPALLDDGWRASCVARVEEDLVVADPAGDGGGVILTDFIAREPRGRPTVWTADLELKRPSASDQLDDAARLLSALPRVEAGEGGDLPLPLPLLRRLPGLLRENDFRCRAAGVDGRILSLEGSGGGPRPLGLAVDIGTTTLAAALCDMTDNRILSVASRTNPQNRRGDDVISRADYATRGPGELAEMSRLAVDALADLCRQCMTAAGAGAGPLFVCVAANPVMNHLFLGIPPAGLAVSPFVPVLREGGSVRGGDIGWPLPGPDPLIHVLPNVAAYVGGDIVAGILAHDVGEGAGNILYLDIGTNGEIVLASGGRLLACATAAGPAFEGARIGQGMRAAAGAIARVEVTAAGTLGVGVIDGAPARGLCGTGLLDAMAALRRTGVLDATGRLLDADEAAAGNPDAAPALLGMIHAAGDGSGAGVWLVGPGTDGGPGVALTQRDAREFQLAKGAVAAGTRMLLEIAGVAPGELDAVMLAGGFGNYLDPLSALSVGLIPAGAPRERIHSVGNAALAGARLCLASRDERLAAAALARRMEYVELSGNAGFQAAFAEEMLFPEE